MGEAEVTFPQACLAGAWLSADALALAGFQTPRFQDETQKHTVQPR